MILAVHTDHLQQVNIGRTGSQYTVDDGVTGQHIVDKQRVGSGDVSMYGIIIDTVAVCVIVETAGRTYLVVKHPCRRVVCLDSRLHEKRTAQHIGHITIETLHILRGIAKTHTVLVGVRIDETGAELDELRIHRVVHAGSETLIVWTGTFQGTFLLEIVESYIIGAIGTTTAEVQVMVLADTRLEHFVEPVGIGIIPESVCTVNKAISSGKRCSRVGACLTEILAVLVGVHHVIHTLRNLIDTEVAFIVDSQRLVFLTVLCGDDDHTVSST